MWNFPYREEWQWKRKKGKGEQWGKKMKRGKEWNKGEILKEIKEIIQMEERILKLSDSVNTT